MQQKFYIQSFAFAGDKTAIPDALQPSGVVSFNQGYGFDYQRELGVDPDAKSIERNQMNWLLGSITDQLGQYQRESIPEFITTADNGGTPYPYARGVMVRYRATGGDPFLTYVSKTAGNVATPTSGVSDANWELLIFERATNAQAITGTDTNTIITPASLAAAIAASSVSVPPASETVAGIAEIATTAEVNAGTDNTRIITPAKLAAYVPAASTTVVGKTRLATVAEAQAGTLSTIAVTPAGLAAVAAGITPPAASETVAGIAEIATTAEVNAGTDNARIVTPAKLAAYVPAASTTVIGKTRLATVAETSAMALSTVAVTPASLATIMGTKADLSGATFTGAVVVSGAGMTAQSYVGNSGGNLSMGTTGAASVFLRPNGIASTTGQLSIASTGNVTINGSCTATGGFQNGSSRRIKRELRAMPYGLSQVLNIETALGKYAEDIDASGREFLFVIAEQLRPYLPQVVGESDSIREGQMIPTVDYLQLIPVLIEAVKELHERLVKLEG